MSAVELSLLDKITVVPSFMGGKPTIRLLRFPVSDALEILANNMSSELILEQHPILEKEDIKACLMYAAQTVNTTAIISPA